MGKFYLLHGKVASGDTGLVGGVYISTNIDYASEI